MGVRWIRLAGLATVLVLAMVLAACRPLGGVTMVSAGLQATCAVTSEGTVLCWGRDYGWEDSDLTHPEVVEGLDTAVAVTVGDRHQCVLESDGRVECWGSNYEGQLGNGQTSTWRSSVPVPVVGGLLDVASIDAGGEHTCAVTAGQAAFCWGSTFHYALGTTGADHEDPMPVTALGQQVAEISAGEAHWPVPVDGLDRPAGRMHRHADRSNVGADRGALRSPIGDAGRTRGVVVGGQRWSGDPR